MGWGNILGTETILPRSGNSDEIIFETGKPKVLTVLGEPYSFFQHVFEVETVDPATGQKTTTMRIANCAKTKRDPYAPCPLCDGQQIRRRIRHVADAFDHELREAKTLAAGETVWKPIATIAGMNGGQLGNIQFIVAKTGQTRNDTTYAVSSMPLANPIPDGIQLRDMEQIYAPTPIAEMQQMAESLGLNWHTITNPPALTFFASMEEALAHVVPNTKYKGQTMQQIYATNPGMIKFFSNSNRVSPEKAAAQMILVAYENMNIPGVPNFRPGGAPQYQAPAQAAPAAPVAAPVYQAPAQAAPPPVYQAPAPAAPVYQPPAQAAPPPVYQAPAPVAAPVQAAPIINIGGTPAPAPAAAPPPVQAQAAPAPVYQAPAPAAPAGMDKNTKVEMINNLLRTNPRLQAGGFPAIMEMVKRIGNGKMTIVEFGDAELDVMLAECQRTV